MSHFSGLHPNQHHATSYPFDSSALKSITSYLWNVTSSVSQTVISSIPQHHFLDSFSTKANENVLFSKFAEFKWFGRRRTFLLLGRLKGFQIWHIPTVGSEDALLIFSKTEGLGPINQIEMMHSIKPTSEKKKLESVDGHSNQNSSQKSAEIQFIVHDISQPQSILMIDLKSAKITKAATLESNFSSITHIQSKYGICIVSTVDSSSIHVFNLSDWTLLHVLEDYQSPMPRTFYKSFDFGSKYLVYSSSEPALDEIYSPSIRQSAEKLTSNFVQGFKNVVGSGTTMVKNYVQDSLKKGADHHTPASSGLDETTSDSSSVVNNNQSDDQKSTASSGHSVEQQHEVPTNPVYNGTIKIVDLANFKVLHHWKGHTNPIANIIFSPCETYFLTHSSVANNFYVWLLAQSDNTKLGKNPSNLCGGLHGNSSKPIRMPAYKLERGYTAANVQSICFSADSKWIAVTTSNGTTHFYLIHPGGQKYLHGLLSYSQDLAIINGFKDSFVAPIFKIYKSLYKHTLGSKLFDEQQQNKRMSSSLQETTNVYPVARLKHSLENNFSWAASFFGGQQSPSDKEAQVSSIEHLFRLCPLVCSTFLPFVQILEPESSHVSSSPTNQRNLSNDDSSLLLKQNLLFYQRNTGVLKRYHHDAQTFPPVNGKQHLQSQHQTPEETNNSHKSRSNHSGSLSGWSLTGQMLLSSFQSFDENYSSLKPKPVVQIQDVYSQNLSQHQQVDVDDEDNEREIDSEANRIISMLTTMNTDLSSTNAKSLSSQDTQWVPSVQVQTFDVALYGPPLWMRPKFQFGSFDQHGMNADSFSPTSIRSPHSDHVQSTAVDPESSTMDSTAEEPISSPTKTTHNHGHRKHSNNKKKKKKGSSAKMPHAGDNTNSSGTNAIEKEDKHQVAQQPSKLEEQQLLKNIEIANKEKETIQDSMEGYFETPHIIPFKVLRTRNSSKNSESHPRSESSNITIDVSLAMDSGLSNPIPIPNAYDISFEDACIVDDKN